MKQKGVRVKFLEAIGMMIACKRLPSTSSSPARAELLSSIIVEATYVGPHK